MIFNILVFCFVFNFNNDTNTAILKDTFYIIK